MKVAGKMGIGAPSDSSELKEKLKKIEERVYTHDSKFADLQLAIDSTSVNLQMHQMIPHEASNNQEQNVNFEKLQEEFGQYKEKIAELDKLMKSKPQIIEKQIPKTEIKNYDEKIKQIDSLSHQIEESNKKLHAELTKQREDIAKQINKMDQAISKKADNEKLKAAVEELKHS